MMEILMYSLVKVNIHRNQPPQQATPSRKLTPYGLMMERVLFGLPEFPRNSNPSAIGGTEVLNIELVIEKYEFAVNSTHMLIVSMEIILFSPAESEFVALQQTYMELVL